MPNGMFFAPVAFFRSSSAQRGSLYVPTGGDTSFVWLNLKKRGKIEGNEENLKKRKNETDTVLISKTGQKC